MGDARFPPGLEPVDDVGPAAWVIDALRDSPSGPFPVRHLVPPVFEAYALIPHSPPEPVGELDEHAVGTLSAVLAGQTATPEDCWFALWSGFGLFEPAFARLRPAGAPRERPADPRMRLAEGTAARSARRAGRRLATFDLLGGWRSYWLLRGSVRDARRFRFVGSSHAPTLWWPEDRAWFVHTEVDARSTLVGGSPGLGAELVAVERLRTTEVGPEDPALG
jgi:hypothetical protein